ncbi:MAG: 50S ribosomal protein L32 [Myxococcota bacterium]
MAVPKKRKSHSRTRMHRNHLALEPKRWVTCAQCSEPMTLHQVCSHCGYYRSREVVKTEV